MERPDVDGIDGLSPSISIEQKTPAAARSTVGTITEIYDYLRLLYAPSQAALPELRQGDRPPIRRPDRQPRSRSQAEDRVMILAPIVRGRKGEFKKEMEKLVQQGFTRARVDGEIVSLEDDLQLDKRKNHTSKWCDRLLVKPGIEGRLENSVAVAMKLAEGLVQVAIVGGDEQLYSRNSPAPTAAISVAQLEPRSFSFNSLYGRVPSVTASAASTISIPTKSSTTGRSRCWMAASAPARPHQSPQHDRDCRQGPQHRPAPPFDQLTQKAQNMFLYGDHQSTASHAKGFQNRIPRILAYSNAISRSPRLTATVSR